MKHLLYTLLTTFIFFSCSSDDKPDQQPPELSVTTTEYTTSFYTAGETEALTSTTNWNGEQGSYAFSGDVPQGITIDEDTGVVYWNKTLPLGENNVAIVAINSAGASEEVVLNINNIFSGSFSGNFSTDPDPEGELTYNIFMTFNEDGSGTSSSGVFSWTRSNLNIDVHYTNATYLFTLVYDTAAAVLDGYWTFYPNPDVIIGHAHLELVAD